MSMEMGHSHQVKATTADQKYLLMKDVYRRILDLCELLDDCITGAMI